MSDILRSDPLFSGEKNIHDAVVSAGYENPTLNLALYHELNEKVLKGHTTMTGWMIDEVIQESEAEKFPNLLGEFDPDQPRVYKGMWL